MNIRFIPDKRSKFLERITAQVKHTMNKATVQFISTIIPMNIRFYSKQNSKFLGCITAQVTHDQLNHNALIVDYLNCSFLS